MTSTHWHVGSTATAVAFVHEESGPENLLCKRVCRFRSTYCDERLDDNGRHGHDLESVEIGV